MASLMLDEMQIGVKTLGGTWIGIDPGVRNARGSPDDVLDELLSQQGAKNVKRRPLWSGLLRSKTAASVSFKISPLLSTVRVKFRGITSIDLPLDGRTKSYIPVFFEPRRAQWRCLSRSYSHITAQSIHPHGPMTTLWRFHLEEGGDRLRLEAEFVEESVTITRYFKRTKRLPDDDSFAEADFVHRNCEKMRGKTSLTSVEEDPVLGVHARCGCMPFFRRTQKGFSNDAL